MSYLDQVVQFIQQNTSGVNLSTTSEYSDPFTGATTIPRQLQDLHLPDFVLHLSGASRYQATGSSAGAASSAYGDPFTGGTRYQPPTTTSSSAPSGYGDPFTGGSRYAPPSSAPPPQPLAAASTTSVIPVVSDLLHFASLWRHDGQRSSCAVDVSVIQARERKRHARQGQRVRRWVPK